MRTLDCQDMPDKVRDAYFEHTRGESNDVYLSWYFRDADPEDYEKEVYERIKLVDDWIETRFKKIRKGSQILINHWW